MFDHEGFSRSMKLALADYLSGKVPDMGHLASWLKELSGFNAKLLLTGTDRKAFWINLYNGLTNYLIISQGIRESVWELPGFFKALKVSVGGFTLSLDDIEHGILRCNGARRNGKPSQFAKDDPKLGLMVKAFDPRIHFALNCGSISCPPVAFYTATNIDSELALAEENFVRQEFVVDHQHKEIRCSEIFVWYREDFQHTYLNRHDLEGYAVYPAPYQWKLPGSL